MDFDLNDLFHQLSVKANVVRKAVDFCKGDKAATVAVINSIYLEVGDIRRALENLKALIEKLHQMHKKVAFFATHLGLETSQYNEIASNLPKRLIAAPNQAKRKNDVQESSTATGKSKSKDQGHKAKVDVDIPVLPYLTLDQFESIPKYMRGRLTYEGLNSAVEEYNVALLAKYNFLRKGFPATGSLADKKKFKELRTLETKDTKGVYFVVADDLRGGASLKNETNRRTIFPILRHLQLTREIRGPGSIVRFAVV